MSKRIGVTVATLLAAGAVGLTGATAAGSSPGHEKKRAKCATVCPQVYQPVTCKLSDGSTRTFGNRCEAGVYACRHKLKIVSCREGV